MEITRLSRSSIASLSTVLDRHRTSWESLCSTATQIILFGSASCRLQTKDSDIDLLCVGTGERIRSPKLDLKWITPKGLHSPKWLYSELATHIASFGIWIHGQDNWSSKTRITEKTLSFKRRLIAGRLAGLRTRWLLLAPAYREKHVIKIRRDLQRLTLLVQGHAVFPTPALDFSWSVEKEKEEALLKMARSGAPKALLSPADIELFGNFLRTTFLPLQSKTYRLHVGKWVRNYWAPNGATRSFSFASSRTAKGSAAASLANVSKTEVGSDD
jgi:hypothetical protein